MLTPETMALVVKLRALAKTNDCNSPRSLVKRSPKVKSWFLSQTTQRLRRELINSWAFNARHNQVMPEGDWRVWLLKTGKGWGKNRVISEFIHYKAGLYPQFAGFLAGRTTMDVIKTVVNDTESGLLVTCHKGNPCEFKTHPTQRVVWANGSYCDIHTSEEPDRSRGANYLYGGMDEVATWKRTVDFAGNDCFTNLNFSLRAGKRAGLVAQMVIGSTPRPNKLMKKLIAAAEKGGTYRISTGTMYDNAENLADGYIAEIEDKHKGTRLFRQEALGELLTDVEDAIITHSMLDADRVDEAPELARVVVGVDPALDNKKSSDDTGIYAAGLGVNGHLYALSDRTCHMSPEGWSGRSVGTCREFNTHWIAAETNVIGKAINTLIQMHVKRGDVPITVIPKPASEAKHLRAGHILAFHEKHEAHIVGSQPELEDQLVQVTPTGYMGDCSPNNMDAYVWAAQELMLGHQTSWDDMIAINSEGGARR